MSERLTFGVDFGTSNSAIASTCDGKTEIYDLDDKQNKSQPSSVFIRIDGYHSTGRNAIDDFRSVDQNDIYHFISSVEKTTGFPIAACSIGASIPASALVLRSAITNEANSSTGKNLLLIFPLSRGTRTLPS